MTAPTAPPPAADDSAELANADVESGTFAVGGPPRAGSGSGAPQPGRVDAFFRRFVAGAAGLALVVGFFLEWKMASGTSTESYTGLKLVMADFTDPGQRAAIWSVPAFGVILIALGYWGRRPALIGSLLVGLSLLLVGLTQVLAYLAQSIGPGLWVTAGAAFVALLGGIPWQRVVRGVRAS